MSKSITSRPVDRGYKAAISILDSRRRLKRPDVQTGAEPPRTSSCGDGKATSDLRGTPSIIGMKQWLHQIGHSMAEIDKLNIVHVAGTKGKGSTCAFAECFLRSFGRKTGFPRKTGLYTSPHLIYPEERIRIDSRPISRDLFAQYFFEVWDILAGHEGSPHVLPRYLQLFAIVSLHAFIKENVEATIIETHHGGEYDATNVIEHPLATVITSLGMDHVKQLGPTLENIAWHKAGIFKAGSSGFSSPQDPSAAAVLWSRAAEKGTTLAFVENDQSLPENALQLKPDVQRINCSVALAAVRHFLDVKAPRHCPKFSSSDILFGLSQFCWPGRFQVLIHGKFRWYLDGAHNEMSVIKAAEWFIECTGTQSEPSLRALIFAQVSQERDPKSVLEELASALTAIPIDYVIFTTYRPEQDFELETVIEPVSAPPNQFGDIWKMFHQHSRVLYEPNIQKAMECVREIGIDAEGMHTLITGSQHLVGAALFSLNGGACNMESS